MILIDTFSLRSEWAYYTVLSELTKVATCVAPVYRNYITYMILKLKAITSCLRSSRDILIAVNDHAPGESQMF